MDNKKQTIYSVEMSFLVPLPAMFTRQEIGLTMLANDPEHVKEILSKTPYFKMEGFNILKIEETKDQEIIEEIEDMVEAGELAPEPVDKTKLN